MKSFKQFFIENTSFSDSSAENLHNFLLGLIKSSGGYFTSEEQHRKYDTLTTKYKDYRDEFTGHITNSSNVIESGGNTNIVIETEYKTGYKHVLPTKKTFIIDDKGIKEVTSIGGGKDKRIKRVFTRDESYTPKSVDEFSSDYEVGDTNEEELVLTRKHTTKHNSIMLHFSNIDKTKKFISFTKNHNVHNVITSTQKETGLNNNIPFNIKYKITKIGVYKDELNYTIDVLDISISNKLNMIKKNNQLEDLKFIIDSERFINYKEALMKKHFSPESTTTVEEFIDDVEKALASSK